MSSLMKTFRFVARDILSFIYSAYVEHNLNDAATHIITCTLCLGREVGRTSLSIYAAYCFDSIPFDNIKCLYVLSSVNIQKFSLLDGVDTQICRLRRIYYRR